MNQEIIDKDKRKADGDKFKLKLLFWLFVIVICSMLACILIGVLKAAADMLFVIAGICLVIALLIMWGYSELKLKIHRAEFNHELKQHDKNL